MRKIKRNTIKEKTNICTETPVDLTVNGKDIVTFMCTPQDLKELAVGHLYIKGIIDNFEEINYVAACEEMETINVDVKNELSESKYSLKELLASSCGNAIDKEKLKSIEEIHSKIKVNLSKLRFLASKMFAETVVYKKTGGVHCASIASPKELRYLKEDVGRHNAVDKIIGQGVMEKTDFSNSIIFTSGRISSDMVLKVAKTGFPIIVSRSIPSDLALKIAKEASITVVGRISRSEPIIYTYSDRIIEDK